LNPRTSKKPLSSPSPPLEERAGGEEALSTISRGRFVGRVASAYNPRAIKIAPVGDLRIEIF